MLIQDAAIATARETTPEGFLRVRARIARSGLHLYKARELGCPDGFAPDEEVRVYRPDGEVFAPDAMASFASRPVTLGHPPHMVDSRNWKLHAVGHSATVARDGSHLAADLLITDAEAVARAGAGTQLSNGYQADFDFTPGTTPEGEPYHARQANIRGNHIALVDAGRCGDSCRIGDAAILDCGSAPPSLITVTIDGLAIETIASSAPTVERLRLAIESKDGAIAALTAQLADEGSLEQRVIERTVAVDAARRVFGPGFQATGQPTAAIRRLVAGHLLGAALEGRSDAYVQAAFDALTALRPVSNPLAAELARFTGDAGGREAARQARDRFLTHAWKGEQPHGVS